MPLPGRNESPGAGRLAAWTIAAVLGAGCVPQASADAEAGLHVGKIAATVLGGAGKAAVAAIQDDVQPDQPARAVPGQAFELDGGARALYLVPVSYASKKARNGVCDLVVLDDHLKVTGRARLFGEDFDGDEVVAHCSNVLAAAFRPRTAEHRVDAVYLLATGVINTSRNAASVVAIDAQSGQVRADAKLTSALDDGNEPTSVGPLLARLRKQP